MKNNKSNKYSETAEIINEKRNQISECSINCHADNYVTEKSDYCNDEYKNK